MNSRQFIISAVRNKWPHMSYRQVSLLYNESLNLIYSGIDIPIETWTKLYADRMDNLGNFCIETNDTKGARECWDKAATYRGVGKSQANAIPDSLLDRRIIVYTMDIEKLGIPRCNKSELCAFIDDLDLTMKEKSKVKREALIEGTPFELIQDEDEDRI